MAKSIASTNISIGANLGGLQRGLKIASRSLKRFGASAKRVGSSISKNISLPFALVGAASVKMASDLEGSFGKIENLVGITGKALDDFKTSVKNVSSVTGQSQQELSEAMFTISSAGLRGAEATEVLERAAKASAIGLGETQQVAQALTGVLQAYSKEGLTAAEATDTLTAIVREGNLEAESLAPTLGRIVGIGAQLGISFQELGANIATFTRLGVPAEEAVVGLRGIMTTFLKPTKDAEMALGQLGLTSEDVRKKLGSDGLQSTLAFLMEGFKGNDEALASVFGNVRALSNVLGTAGAQGETYAAVLDNISNSTGIVDEGFKNVSEESGFKFKQTLNELKNTGIELGNALLPLVTNITQFITRAVKAFRNLSTETKTAMLTLVAIVAASGPVMTAIGVISTILPALLGPVGLIIGGIAAAGFAVYKFWDIIRPVLVGAINYFIDLYNETSAFRAVIQYTILTFKNLWVIGEAVFNNFMKALTALGKFWAGVFTFDADLIKEALREAANVVYDSVSDIADGIEKNIGEALENTFTPKEKIELVTEQGMQAGIDDMLAPIKKAWAGIQDLFTFQGGTGGGGVTSTAPAEIIDATGEAAEAATPKVNKLTQAWDGFRENVDVVNLAIGQLGGAFEEVFTEIISGTEKSFRELTGIVVSSLTKMITKLIAAALAAAVLVALLAAAGIGSFSVKNMASFASGFKDIFGQLSGVKLAKGGLAYGETLAVVGDNPNARMDPEVIAPLSKLKNMIGQSGAGGAVTVYGKISGQDILLSSEKASRTRSRYRGF